MPSGIKPFVAMQPTELKSYQQLRAYVVKHLQSKKLWTRADGNKFGAARGSADGPAPMDIGALGGKGKKATLDRTTRKFAKPVEKHVQAHVGMRTKVPRAKTKEKESLSRKETNLRKNPKMGKHKRKTSAVFVATSTMSKIAGIMLRIRIPSQEKVEKATGQQQ